MTNDEMRVDWERWSTRLSRVDPRAEDESDFWSLGVADVEMILADVAHRLPGRLAALELGCGWGRLMRPMAARFREVWGVDISQAMLDRAATAMADVPNIHLRRCNGHDLALLPDQTFDFCYSMFLFDCLPTRALVRGYIQEAHRVLKTGGILKAQVAGVYARNPFRQLYENAGTWHGVRFTLGEIAALLEDEGFEMCSAYHADTAQQLIPEDGKDPSGVQQYRLWVVARKGPHMDPYEAGYWSLARTLVRLLPRAATVISPEPNMADYLTTVAGDDLRLRPFYTPASGAEAVESLERHRSEGGRLLFFTSATAWWLKEYPELADWLNARGRLVHSQEEFRIFDLDPS